ncbi:MULTISPECIES: hypothetical protein [Xanthomonas]|uniref:hypothetical protein n=1 Tax=Xanthomonas TaxID=338 RepID=UPI0012908868|nr:MULTISPECIES: hypothetical protein [Xanthomonas]
MKEVTMDQWRANAKLSPVKQLHFKIMMWDFDRPLYDEWVQLVEDAVLHQISLIANKRNHFKDLSEDTLTGIIELSLTNLELNCAAKNINGNVDIVIEYGDYKWLGEAKIASDVSKIFHGYQQLTSRYATGMPNQTSGGLLLYCNHDQANVILAGWQAALVAQMPQCNARKGPVPLSFRSSDNQNSAGHFFDLIHLAVPLHHEPKEDVVKLSKNAIAAARKARKDVRVEKVAVKRFNSQV